MHLSAGVRDAPAALSTTLAHWWAFSPPKSPAWPHCDRDHDVPLWHGPSLGHDAGTQASRRLGRATARPVSSTLAPQANDESFLTCITRRRCLASSRVVRCVARVCARAVRSTRVVDISSRSFLVTARPRSRAKTVGPWPFESRSSGEAPYRRSAAMTSVDALLAATISGVICSSSSRWSGSAPWCSRSRTMSS